MKLRDWLPPEATGGEYVNDRHIKYLDHEVIKEFSIGKAGFKSWPGHHRNVLHWAILENGQCIGWNESASFGWSFPVLPKKIGKTFVDINETF